jgi:hypothetical protein
VTVVRNKAPTGAERCQASAALVLASLIVQQTTLLCLVNGPWQALSLVAALRQCQLDLSVSSAVALLVDMPEGSSLQQATARILRAHGIDRQHTLDHGLALRALPARLSALRRAGVLDLRAVHTVMTYGMHRPVARYLLNSTPAARVVVYEEGLRAYVPPNTSLRDRLRFRLARTWGRIDRDFGKGWKAPRAWRDVEYALLLADQLPLPEATRQARVHRVEARHLRAALDALPAPRVRDLPERPYVLLVGQYYARLRQLTPTRELSLYSEAVQAIQARGQVAVWRGHLREHDTLFEQLQQRCPGLRSFSDFVDDPGLPLELYADFFGSRCVATVSMSSSALFYLRHIHGTPAYTLLTDALVAPMRYPHKPACLLALRHLPPFARSPYGRGEVLTQQHEVSTL